MYWIHTLSPTHVGTGRGLGYIDLPIHRDATTNWPIIPATAFKGVWADHFGATKDRRDQRLSLAFGKASDGLGDSNAGALIATDARIVCLPVRSLYGTFTWCTAPLALALLKRDCAIAGINGIPADPPTPNVDEVYVTNSSRLFDKSKVFFEELDFNPRHTEQADVWADFISKQLFADAADVAWRSLFRERFAIVPDSAFDFFSETGTEVVARVRIDDETKTVAKGALWNEELLPAETILAGFVSCDRVYSKGANGTTPQDLIREFATQPLSLQIGGNASVGRGRVRCIFTAGNE